MLHIFLLQAPFDLHNAYNIKKHQKFFWNINITCFLYFQFDSSHTGNFLNSMHFKIKELNIWNILIQWMNDIHVDIFSLYFNFNQASWYLQNSWKKFIK